MARDRTLDEAFMQTCFLCRRRFQHGMHVYDGRPIHAWGGVMVCTTCCDANWDGVVPSSYPHLIQHLRSIGVEPNLNEEGFIVMPDRGS